MADDLKKIRELVEIVVKKVRDIELFQISSADQTRFIKDQQSVVNDKLDSMQETLDNHTASLIGIDQTLKGYGDMYKANKEKIGNLEAKVEIIAKKVSVASRN